MLTYSVPASITRTETFEFSESRFARTLPAVPPEGGYDVRNVSEAHKMCKVLSHLR